MNSLDVTTLHTGLVAVRQAQTVSLGFACWWGIRVCEEDTWFWSHRLTTDNAGGKMTTCSVDQLLDRMVSAVAVVPVSWIAFCFHRRRYFVWLFKSGLLSLLALTNQIFFSSKTKNEMKTHRFLCTGGCGGFNEWSWITALWFQVARESRKKR